MIIRIKYEHPDIAELKDFLRPNPFLLRVENQTKFLQ